MYVCMYVNNAAGMQTHLLWTWHCFRARVVEPKSEHALRLSCREVAAIREATCVTTQK